jgi:hypothetical protein
MHAHAEASCDTETFVLDLTRVTVDEMLPATEGFAVCVKAATTRSSQSRSDLHTRSSTTCIPGPRAAAGLEVVEHAQQVQSPRGQLFVSG